MKGRLRELKINSNIWDYYVLDWGKIDNLNKKQMQKLIISKGLDKKLIAEIGCGTGDYLLELSKYYFNYSILGIEHAYTVVQRAVKKLQKNEIENVKLMYFDATLLLKKLGNDRKFEKIFVTFPDPWPKKRHHKRRLIQMDFLENIYTLLQVEGELIIISDHPSYQEWIYNVLKEYGKFKPIFDDYFIDSIETFKNKYPFVESAYYKKSLEKGHKTKFYVLKKS